MVLDGNDQLIIEAKSVNKTYYTGNVEVPALRGVDLKVQKGEMLAIMGPSGCGKTTTLRLIAGLELVTEGKINISGNEVTHLSASDRDLLYPQAAQSTLEHQSGCSVLYVHKSDHRSSRVSDLPPVGR